MVRFHVRHLRVLLAASAAALAALPAAAQMYRCNQGGAVVYQQTSCSGGREIKPPSPPGDRPTPPPAAAPSSAPSAAASAAASAPEPARRMATAPAPAPTGTRDPAAMASICLDWYRGILRDPRGAYQRNARPDGLNAVRMELFATNGYGGYVSREVLCEFKVGSLEIDGGWTKIHADRVRW